VIELAAASLARTGRLRLRVTGTSMLPAIRPGDVLRVERCDAASLSPGEVVLFQRGERLFAHRAVRRGHALALRGDTLDRDDAAVEGAQVLGKVVAIERRGREIAPGASRSLLQRSAARLFAALPLAARLFDRFEALR